MKAQRLVVALGIANVALLLFLLARVSPAGAGGDEVLRGRALEIVDAQGKVRASIRIQPAGKGPDGKPYPETAILRLGDAAGRPEVKIAASERGGAVGLVGASDATQVLLEAQGADAALKLATEDGRQQTVRP